MNALGIGSAAITVFFLVHAGAAQTSPEVLRGQTLVQTHCSECHVVGKTDASPLSVAPPLRNFHERYPVEHLEEAFVECIYSGHSEMPQFQFEPDQINDLIAFQKSLN